jgi:hypothetical protein
MFAKLYQSPDSDIFFKKNGHHFGDTRTKTRGMREVAAISVLILVLACTVHKVPEGHVGVYTFGGALLDEITDPGYSHLLIRYVIIL